MHVQLSSTYLPELLARVLSTHPLQYLCTAGVLVDEALERVYAAVDDDVEALVDVLVIGDLLRGEGLGHCGSKVARLVAVGWMDGCGLGC